MQRSLLSGTRQQIQTASGNIFPVHFQRILNPYMEGILLFLCLHGSCRQAKHNQAHRRHIICHVLLPAFKRHVALHNSPFGNLDLIRRHFDYITCRRINPFDGLLIDNIMAPVLIIIASGSDDFDGIVITAADKLRAPEA